MPPKTIDQEIQARVAAFATELSGLIRESVLSNLHQVLGGDARPRAAAAAPTATAAPQGRGGKKRGRSSGGVAASRITEYVSENPGSRLEHISKGLGTSSDSLKKAVAELLASGGLRKTGQKRGTQYFPGDGSAPAPASKAPGGKKKASKKRVTKRGTK